MYRKKLGGKPKPSYKTSSKAPKKKKKKCLSLYWRQAAVLASLTGFPSKTICFYAALPRRHTISCAV